MKRGIILIILFLALYFLREFLQLRFLQISGHLLKSRNKTQELKGDFKRGSLMSKIKELEKENQDLRKILGLKRKLGRGIPGEVIARIREEISDELIINVGEEKGVTKNSAVITSQGLVGIIESRGRHFSKVMTYSDPRFQISARVASTREIGFLIGRGRGRNLKFLYLDLNTESKPGDFILTSGEGVLPKGLIIGRIQNIYTHSSQLYKIADVIPSVNLNKIEKVLILLKGE